MFCNFCGLSEKDVEFIICGPSVYICDGCVKVCNEIIEDKKRHIHEDNVVGEIRSEIFWELYGTDI